MVQKRLTRSFDRILGGVCGGIAEYFDLDPTLVRVGYAALTLFTAFAGVVLYPVLWIIIPEKPRLTQQ
ncbi:MAG: PspC domain-containing protein [Prevotella sp.]|nr:PspC domain-containing protein [Prevotella sp.]